MEFYPRTFKDSSETFIPDKLVKSDSRETGEEESHKKLEIRSFIHPWFIDLLEASSGFNQEQRIVRMRSNCTRSWKLVYAVRGGIQVRKFVPCLSLWFVWFWGIPWKVNFIRILNLYFEFSRIRKRKSFK